MAYRDDSAARDALADARAVRLRQLPMLDRVDRASSCGHRWDDLMRTADDRVRACGGCRQHVYDASALAADEVDRLILATDGTACVRYFQRADGTLMPADCAVGARRRRRWRYGAAAVAVALAAVAIALTWSPERSRADDDGEVVFDVETGCLPGACDVDSSQPAPQPAPAAVSNEGVAPPR